MTFWRFAAAALITMSAKKGQSPVAALLADTDAIKAVKTARTDENCIV